MTEEKYYNSVLPKNAGLYKVQNMVFRNIGDAEKYCWRKGLDVNEWIEHKQESSWKKDTLQIASYQKAALKEVRRKILESISERQKEIYSCVDIRENLPKRSLEYDHIKKDIENKIAECIAMYNMASLIDSSIIELEDLTGWK